MSASAILSRLSASAPAGVVEVTLIGHTTLVVDVARALASVAVMTSMSHHVTNDAVIRLDATVYRPSRPRMGGGR